MTTSMIMNISIQMFHVPSVYAQSGKSQIYTYSGFCNCGNLGDRQFTETLLFLGASFVKQKREEQKFEYAKTSILSGKTDIYHADVQQEPVEQVYVSRKCESFEAIAVSEALLIAERTVWMQSIMEMHCANMLGDCYLRKIGNCPLLQQ